MNISFDELKDLLLSAANYAGRAVQPVPTPAPVATAEPWQIGKNYFIRTVTHHYTGRLTFVHQTELVIEDAAWIADDGRFAQAIENGELREVEPYPDGSQVIIGRGAVIDAVMVTWKLPRDQK